jgi:taurine dioxygenase
MSLTVTPLSPAFGAGIGGIDFRQPPSPETIRQLNQAWLDHSVLVFRDQQMEEEDQRRFAACFGTVGERARPVARRPEGAEYDGSFMLISNDRNAAGEPIGSLPDGELWFHHDMSYVPEPHKATILYAIHIPATGGNTKFANMYKAYDNVPRDLKDRLAGRRVLQIYDFAMIEKVDIDADTAGIKQQWQPIFVSHPETGRPALFVSRLMSALIEGLDRAESDAALEQLFEISEDPAVIYEHVWQPGDLLMWDNRCSIHARTDFPATERRLLRRCTVEGGPMVAAA